MTVYEVSVWQKATVEWLYQVEAESAEDATRRAEAGAYLSERQGQVLGFDLLWWGEAEAEEVGE